MSVVDVERFKGDFFHILQETERTQTAVMTIPPGSDAGPEETHEGDQIVFVLDGRARLRIGEIEHDAEPGACVTVPAGTRHHVKSVGSAPLFFLTIYAPPAY